MPSHGPHYLDHFASKPLVCTNRIITFPLGFPSSTWVCDKIVLTARPAHVAIQSEDRTLPMLLGKLVQETGIQATLVALALGYNFQRFPCHPRRLRDIQAYEHCLHCPTSNISLITWISSRKFPSKHWKKSAKKRESSCLLLEVQLYFPMLLIKMKRIKREWVRGHE